MNKPFNAIQHAVETFMGYSSELYYFSKKWSEEAYNSRSEEITNKVKQQLTDLVNFGFPDALEQVYNNFSDNYVRHKKLLHILLSTIATKVEEEKEILQFIQEDEYLITDATTNNLTLKDHINLLFNVKFNSEEDLVLKKKSYFLNVLLDSYLEKHYFTPAGKQQCLNKLLIFSINNNLDDKINFFLSKGASSPIHQKELFIKALETKNVVRLNLMWNPVEHPLDLKQIIPVKLKLSSKTQSLDDFSLFRVIQQMHSLSEGDNNERAFDRLITNNHFLYEDKLRKANQAVMNSFTKLPSVKNEDKEEPRWLTLVKDEIYERTPIVSSKEQEDVVETPKKNIVIEPVNPFNIGKTFKNLVVETKDSINIPIKTSESSEKKKSAKSLINLNNEVVTRKHLQREWDKKLIHSFFEKGRPMFALLKEFYQENHISKELLEKSNVIIFRQPSHAYQMAKFNHFFIGTFLKPLNDLLFNETKQSLQDNEATILENIVSQKIRTNNNPNFKRNKEDLEELNKASNDYTIAKNIRVLRRYIKEETSKHNWTKVK